MKRKGRSATGDRNGAKRHPERVSAGLRARNAVDLSWCVRGERHYAARFTEAMIREIRRLAATGKTHREIAGIYGVSRSAIQFIVSRKRWQHVTDLDERA